MIKHLVISCCSSSHHFEANQLDLKKKELEVKEKELEVKVKELEVKEKELEVKEKELEDRKRGIFSLFLFLLLIY